MIFDHIICCQYLQYKEKIKVEPKIFVFKAMITFFKSYYCSSHRNLDSHKLFSLPVKKWT